MLKPYFNLDQVGAGRFSSVAVADPEIQFDYKQNVMYKIRVYVGWKDFSPVNSADLLFRFTSTNTPAIDKAFFQFGLSPSSNPLDSATFGAVTFSFFVTAGFNFVNTIGTFWINQYFEGFFMDTISDGTFGLEWGTVTGLHVTSRAPGSFIIAEPIGAASEPL